MRFRRIRGVKRSVFAENAEWNGAFSAITRYSRESSYVLGFNTYLNKIFLFLGLGLVYYWMMPKNCEKRTIKSRACVPLTPPSPRKLWTEVTENWKRLFLCNKWNSKRNQVWSLYAPIGNGKCFAERAINIYFPFLNVSPSAIFYFFLLFVSCFLFFNFSLIGIYMYWYLFI